MNSTLYVEILMSSLKSLLKRYVLSLRRKLTNNDFFLCHCAQDFSQYREYCTHYTDANLFLLKTMAENEKLKLFITVTSSHQKGIAAGNSVHFLHSTYNETCSTHGYMPYRTRVE